MIINDKKGYIFIHIPRTAGTHLYSCLDGEKYDDLYYGHAFARKIQHLFANEWEDYYSFSIVRNDYDRLHSWWYNRRYLEHTVNVDFETWLLREPVPIVDIHSNWDIDDCWENGSQRTSQLEWLTNKGGQIIVDRIIHYDNLNNELRSLGKIINVDFSKMPRHGSNNSGKRDYKEAYTPEMIEFVKKYHKKSLNTFNYEF